MGPQVSAFTIKNVCLKPELQFCTISMVTGRRQEPTQKDKERQTGEGS